jgi:hypothetical protein
MREISNMILIFEKGVVREKKFFKRNSQLDSTVWIKGFTREMDKLKAFYRISMILFFELQVLWELLAIWPPLFKEKVLWGKMAKLLYFSDEIFIVEISYMIQLLRKGIFLRANCLNKIKVFVGEILATQFSFLN